MLFASGDGVSPVCRVVTVSISAIPHSASATGLCIVFFGTMQKSPGFSTTSSRPSN